MPIMNGFDVLPLVKAKFDAINMKRNIQFNEENKTEGKSPDDSPAIIRPLICYLSQFNAATMKNFLQEDEFAECYLEKPLPPSELRSLLKLLKLL
jgi:hypothetical protein